MLQDYGRFMDITEFYGCIYSLCVLLDVFVVTINCAFLCLYAGPAYFIVMIVHLDSTTLYPSTLVVKFFEYILFS